jgi:EAL domain-containing protein (putative c-di-GMP-specific phosphodiesterase class I)
VDLRDYLAPAAGNGGTPAGADALALRRLLRSVAARLGADMAYICELGDEQVVALVEDVAGAFATKEGDRLPLSESYCYRVLSSEMPSLICDAVNDPHVRDLASTRAIGIGAYIGVPVELPNGRVFGTLCVASRRPRPDLDHGAVAELRAYASLVGTYVRDVSDAVDGEAATRSRISEVVEKGQVRPLFQRIVDLTADNAVVGYEALSRFPGPDPRPLRWLADAEAVGLRGELEMAAASAALGALARLPSSRYLSLNFSPRVLGELPRLDIERLARDVPFERVIVEVTEDAPVVDYDGFGAVLEPLRSRGAGLAIDDAGAGFASMMHIVRLRPDMIKLDIALVRGIEADPSRRALAASLATFGREIGARVVAEGVETEAERDAILESGVNYAQGYLFGRPAVLSSLGD